MIQYRRITAAEVDALAAFAIEGMPAADHPHLRIDPGKVRAVVQHFVNSPNDFQLAAFDGPVIVGGIAAAVAEMMYFERAEAHVVMCQARGRPGVGRVLLQALLDWANADMRIRQIQFPEEANARPGFCRLLRAYGFNRVQRVCIYQK